MPCNDTRESYTPHYVESIVDRSNQILNDFKIATERLDNVTRLLCSVMKKKEGGEFTFDVASINGLAEWWTEHQEHDSQRLKKVFDHLMTQLDEDDIEALKMYFPFQQKSLSESN